jgi:imidazolonepropionase
VEELTESAAERLQRMFRHGTTTAESKSGYGLSLQDELRILQVNRRLSATQPVDVVSTFLGAHALPPEMSRERYMELVVKEMIPRVAADGLAEFCDVFCDEGYFTVEEARHILEAGRAAGLKAKIHADQYSAIGASEMAAEIGAVSADHLNYCERGSMRKLTRAGVVGVVTPALDFAVQHPRPFDARAMIEEGMPIAIATDLCPACWVESMQLVMAFACRQYGLSPAEALNAGTVGGARALGVTDRGSIEPGKLADLQSWDLPTFEDVVYRIGNNAVSMVVKRGKVYRFG